jgi:hypothetical protein
LLSSLVHPDYLIERRARQTYEHLLGYLRDLVARQRVWVALPGEVNDWWRARSEMELVNGPNGWEIVGASSDRAVLAYAVLDGGQIQYEVVDRRAAMEVGTQH